MQIGIGPDFDKRIEQAIGARRNDKENKIHIKLKEYSGKTMNSKRSIIFKGKYCQTYMLEEDEILLRNNNYVF